MSLDLALLLACELRCHTNLIHGLPRGLVHPVNANRHRVFTRSDRSRLSSKSSRLSMTTSKWWFEMTVSFDRSSGLLSSLLAFLLALRSFPLVFIYLNITTGSMVQFYLVVAIELGVESDHSNDSSQGEVMKRKRKRNWKSHQIASDEPERKIIVSTDCFLLLIDTISLILSTWSFQIKYDSPNFTAHPV